MVNVNVSLIMELRKRTKMSILECKNALIDSNGNIDIAINNMYKLGKLRCVHESKHHVLLSGKIFTKLSKNEKYGIIVKINCKTDFAARSNEVSLFIEKVVNTALHKRIINLSDLQCFFKDELGILMSKLNEDVSISDVKFMNGELVYSYIHNNRIGVLISGVNVDKKIMKNIAMHIASMNPKYINNLNIPYNIIENEKQKILSNDPLLLNKSRKVRDEIIEKKLVQFITDNTLMNQLLVTDNSKTVGNFLYENKSKIDNFIRLEI